MRLQAKYREIAYEVRYENFQTEDAEYLLVAYGVSSRICQKAVEVARENGLKVGLLRPITPYPFPYMPIKLAPQLKGIISVEMSAGSNG